uniref:Uncharacterized protein n=1 Tax=Melopsittacus undulatus TaxID=13146 RepID=A0A8V5GDW8_MELUD
MSLISEPSLEPVPSSASADSSNAPRSLTVDNSALPSQGKSAETALDELWALELSAHVPEVQAKNDSTLNPVYEPSVVALDRWDVFPDTKKQLGFAVEKGQELKAEVLHETKVDGCPGQVKKRQSRDRTPKKAGAANMNKAGGDQENEQFRSSAVTPESPEHIWKTELDLPCASKPPIERISASGQAVCLGSPTLTACSSESVTDSCMSQRFEILCFILWSLLHVSQQHRTWQFAGTSL